MLLEAAGLRQVYMLDRVEADLAKGFPLACGWWQVWLCVPPTFLSPACPIEPSNLACYVFNELNQTFAFWAPNSRLRLVLQP